VRPVVAITGLAAEANIARRAGWHAIATGGNARRAEEAIARAIAQDARALVSFGLAGALDPSLRPGRLLLPPRVCDEAGARIAVDASWHAAMWAKLQASGIACNSGEMLGGAAIAASPERKCQLRRQSGAVAVDLESHLVARAAAGAGLPFLVLRAIADPAERSLPPAALLDLSAEGKPAFWPVLRSVLHQPQQIGGLLQIAGDTRHALRALRQASRVIAASSAQSPQF
jgi:adenosylhomocysteine nucleosidase